MERNLPGAKEGLRTLPGSTKRFLFGWRVSDRCPRSAEHYSRQADVFLLTRVRGRQRSKLGDFYYQIEYMLDPDGTARIRARNKVELTSEDFKFAKKIMSSSTFASEFKEKLLIQDLPGTVNSDTGLETTIPDMVRKKKEAASKAKRK